MLEKFKKNIRVLGEEVVNDEILNKENLKKNIIKNIKILSSVLYIMVIYSVKIIYTFFLENYYSIPGKFFKLNFEDSFLWGVVIFIIIILGLYLIFLLPFDKKVIEKSEKRIDRAFFLSRKIFQFIAIFYFQYLLLFINFIKYFGFFVKLSGGKIYVIWLVVILTILFLIIIDYFTIFTIKYKKIFKIISFLILIVFILFFIVNKHKNTYQIIWINNTPNVILCETEKELLITECDLDEENKLLNIRTKKYKKILNDNEYERSYFYFNNVTIEKNN